MLITKQVEITWNPQNKNHYAEKGYTYTKMRDTFIVDVNDLTESSNYRVDVRCDYCGHISSVRWADYTKMKKNNPYNQKDCCSQRECCEKKQKETCLRKYGVDNALKLEEVQDKIKHTNLERYGVENVFASKEIQEKIKNTNINKYGVKNPILNSDIRDKAYQTNLMRYGSENPFGSKEIQEKIRQTNLERYGVEVPTQNPEIHAKAVQTNLEKYGEVSYGVIWGKEHRGELSPTWKGGVAHHRVERSTHEYRMWRKAVFDRDKYTCRCCGDKSAKGHPVILASHHIKNWKDNPDCRYDVDNGITLCERCHLDFHSQYGKSSNTKEQLEEFINQHNSDKKVC